MTEKRTEYRGTAPGHAVHDVGGLALPDDISGPIDMHEHDPALWEKRTDAMLRLLVSPAKGAFPIDAMRRVIESYAEQQYDSTTYYEKWIRAVRNLCLEQGLFTEAELQSKLADARAAFEAEGRAVSDGEVPADRRGAPLGASE